MFREIESSREWNCARWDSMIDWSKSRFVEEGLFGFPLLVPPCRESTCFVSKSRTISSCDPRDCSEVSLAPSSPEEEEDTRGDARTDVMFGLENC